MSERPDIFRGFWLGLKAFFELLPQLRDLPAILRRVVASLCRWVRGPPLPRRSGCCIDIPITEYKRPDPLLYSQFFLMKQGLAVTWDNPDIQLYDGGAAVNSNQLSADHDYDVVVRIWNNSYDAPAANLPVYLLFLDFGVGTTAKLIGKTYVDLGVKASADCPVFAKFSWHTPKTGGHYCLQAALDWPDDANPDNNTGQENTNVAQLHSPATFTFPVRNDAGIVRRFELEVDVYQLPRREPCPPPGDTKVPERPTRLNESRARWKKALDTQGYARFPVGPEWRVKIEPDVFTLGPDEERPVRIEIERAAGAFKGRQPFNINCFANGPHQPRQFVGGVTLVVEEG